MTALVIVPWLIGFVVGGVGYYFMPNRSISSIFRWVFIVLTWGVGTELVGNTATMAVGLAVAYAAGAFIGYRFSKTKAIVSSPAERRFVIWLLFVIAWGVLTVAIEQRLGLSLSNPRHFLVDVTTGIPMWLLHRFMGPRLLTKTAKA